MSAGVLVGAWRLVSQHTEYPDGRVEPSRGEHPDGLLMYDSLGNMSVQLMRTDARAAEFTDTASFDAVMAGYHAYFGAYEVDEDARIVRHFVVGSAYQPYRGTVQVRHYVLADDLLTLATEPGPDGSRRLLVWRLLTGPVQPQPPGR